MTSQPRNIRPVIRQLDQTAINRIAAGEVVERPAAAVKELIENAIDAGARQITIDIADGGKTLIRVSDDGCGMAASDLPLALTRHATSKIDGSDLLNIHTFGFRGEALPSLGAVGRLTVASRAVGQDPCEISVAGGTVSPIRPTAHHPGTTVTLRDLFYATPARLKFLKSDRAELQAVTDTVRRLAMAEPAVGFILRDVTGGGTRQILRADAEQGDLFAARGDRLRRILGRDFADNAVPVDATRDGVHLTGMAALPTYSRGSAVTQFLFVNGRPVRDKMLIGALRAAYRDVLSRDRHPAAALFITCDPEFVDVNVHPAKTEVRFRDAGIVRGLMISALRHALAEAGHRASTTVGDATLGAMAPAQPGTARIYQMDRPSAGARAASYAAQAPLPPSQGFAEMREDFSARVPPPDTTPAPQDGADLPLGTARGQLHETYIIAQSTDGIILVDQHAAHERLVYERLKSQAAEKNVPSQALLIPEVVDLGAEDAARVIEVAAELSQLGLHVDAFGAGAVAVRETPAILGAVSCAPLLRDIADELAENGTSDLLSRRIDAILSRISCHGSVRAGRRMHADEMNALLREMEATPMSGQCNHGRPTYVELKLSDIERLFGRT